MAIALGVKAVECGLSVAFFRLEELLHAMRKDAEVPPTRLKGKKYMKAALVIVDEVGFEQFSRQACLERRGGGRHQFGPWHGGAGLWSQQSHHGVIGHGQHRLLARFADAQVVGDDGGLVEPGIHEALLATAVLNEVVRQAHRQARPPQI